MANANELQQELLGLVRAPGSPAAAPSDVAALLALGSQSPAGQLPAAADIAAGDTTPVAELVRELDALRRQLGSSEETARRQSEELAQYARVVKEGATSTSVGSGVSAVTDDLLSAFRGAGGLGVLGSPLFGLVSRLFRRRDTDAVPDLPAYAEPAAVREDLAVPPQGSGLVAVSYGADGLPRSAAPAPAPSAPAAAASSVTIQVQTLDSRSFLDNSDQIARAVREAMLNSHSLNDVIGEM